MVAQGGVGMARHRKLLERVRNNPRDVRFSDLLTLVEAHGFVLIGPGGTSHRQYRHPKSRTRLNVQPRADGKAKRYQVEQFLAAIDEFGLRLEGEA